MSFFEIVIPACVAYLKREALDRVEHRRDRVGAVAVDELGDEDVDLALRERAVDEACARPASPTTDGLLERRARPRVLKITRPGVVRTSSPCQRYSIGSCRPTSFDSRWNSTSSSFWKRLMPLELLLLRERLGGRRREVEPGVGQVVDAEHHVLRRRRERPPVRRREDVVRREHQDARLRLRLRGERQVDGHLVAVEVGVERVADERVHLDRLALDEHGLERLDAEAVERRSAVQQHRMLRDHLFEHVPDLGRHRLDVLLRRLDVLDRLALDEPAHDERLEELERHQLRQAALVQLQVRAGDDHRAAGVVDALAEQVLAEPALLALEHVGERLQRPVARAGDRAAAAAVVEQRVDGLLQHPLLVVDDDLGRAEVEQPLEAVVPVDHAPVEVVQVAGGEAATVELHHRAQLRRNHRHGLEDHPLGLVLRGDERRDDLQALDRALLLLALRGLDRLAERPRLLGQVEVAEQVADRLRAHAAAEVDAEAVRASRSGP